MQCLFENIESEKVVFVNDFKALKTVKDLSTKKLCIVKTDFRNLKKIKTFFKKYPALKVWLTSNEISRKNILNANINGFENVIQYPINTQLVRNFLNEKPKTESKQTEINISSSIKSANVMIVDDNPMNIELLTETLACPQINLSSFTKPIDTFKAIETEEFDLFLLDIMMPDISGFDLARIIKNSKLNSNTPIMFISALSDANNKIKGYNLGSYAYIEKPFDINVVRSQVFNLLKTKSLQDALFDKKETFFAMVTHDLKSPVNAEITALEFLLENHKSNMNPFQNEIIGDILEAAKYMKSLVDNILNKYKCDNGVLKMRPQKFPLNNIIIQCIEEMKYIFEDRNQNIQYKNSVKNSETMIDYIEMKRVIHNLMVNASEYATKNSEINLTLTEDKNLLIFSVQNNGLGINLKNPNEIFEKYVSYAQKYKKIGTGLGLYIAKRIIEAHNGKIFVESKVNEYTKITFTLQKA